MENRKRRSVAIILGGSVTGIWQRPVVESVLLPTHANTTIVCVPLIVPGFSFSCENPLPNRITHYEIRQKFDECPELIEVSAPTERSTFSVETGLENGRVFVQWSIGILPYLIVELRGCGTNSEVFNPGTTFASRSILSEPAGVEFIFAPVVNRMPSGEVIVEDLVIRNDIAVGSFPSLG